MSSFSKAQQRPIWRKAWDRVTDKFNWKFRKQQHVYLFDPSIPAPPSPGDLQIESFEHGRNLYPKLADTIRQYLGAPVLQGDLTEIRSGGVFWAGFLDGEMVGSAITLRGEQFRRWLMPLESKDRVLFRLRTLPPYRGRGIGAYLLRSIALKETARGGRVYVDCRVFNTPSIRTIEKAGFSRVATVKSLTREEAMGA